MRLSQLTELQRALLEILPIAPDGESLAALAEELLGRRGPAERGRIRRGLEGLSATLGGIHVGRGMDALDRPGAVLYGLRRRDMRRVRAFFGRKATGTPPRKKAAGTPTGKRAETRL